MMVLPCSGFRGYQTLRGLSVGVACVLMGWLMLAVTACPATAEEPGEAKGELPGAGAGEARVTPGEISEAFRERDGLPVRWVLVAIGVMLVGVAAISLGRVLWRYARGEVTLRPLPAVRFVRWAEQCGLSRSQQWLLWRIARQQGLPTPLTLLLSPRTLRVHGHLYIEARGEASRSDRRGLCAVRRRVFGDRPYS